MNKYKCDWCKKELTEIAFEAYIYYKGDSYQHLFCCEAHARDKAWSKTEINKINLKQWGESK